MDILDDDKKDFRLHRRYLLTTGFIVWLFKLGGATIDSSFSVLGTKLNFTYPQVIEVGLILLFFYSFIRYLQFYNEFAFKLFNDGAIDYLNMRMKLHVKRQLIKKLSKEHPGLNIRSPIPEYSELRVCSKEYDLFLDDDDPNRIEPEQIMVDFEMRELIKRAILLKLRYYISRPGFTNYVIPVIFGFSTTLFIIIEHFWF